MRVFNATLLLWLAIAVTAEAQAAETEVVFGSPTPASANLANLTAATELGYFAQEGIKLKIQEFQGSAITMSQVAVKSVLIAGGGGEPLVITHEPGKSPLPLKFFYNGFRNYVWEWVVPPNSPINSIADLKGKKVGVGSLTNGHVTVSRLVLKDNGVGPRDAQFIGIGQGSAAFKALMDGQVDVYNTYTGNIAFFEVNGIKLKHLPVPERFADLFTFGYFAHEDTVKAKPQLLAGFARAVAKGTLVCKVSPAWCVKTFWKYYPGLKPREKVDEELARQVYILSENMKAYLAFPPGQPARFGEFPAGAWELMVNTLYEGGALTTNKIDTKGFFTNDLVAQINDFDAKGIEATAAQLK